jgi:hypothetical protein
MAGLEVQAVLCLGIRKFYLVGVHPYPQSAGLVTFRLRLNTHDNPIVSMMWDHKAASPPWVTEMTMN